MSNLFCAISGLGHLHGCTDASKHPLHPYPTRQRARDAAACALMLCPAFFFYFLISLRWLTRADACWIGLIHANSSRIDPYWVKPPKRRNSKKKKKVQNLLLFLSLSWFPTSTQSRCCVNWFRNTKERLKKEKAWIGKGSE